MQITSIVSCPSSRDQYVECCKRAVEEFLSTCKRVSYQYFYKREKYNESTGKRHKLGPKVGVVIGYIDQEGKLLMGASRCNLKSGDKFDRYIGLYRAISRSKHVIGLEASCVFKDIPESLHRAFAHVFDRMHEFAAT